MKVLYLVPQPKQPGQIGAYTFLDEEIQALAHRGVEAFVLSGVEESDTVVDSVRLMSSTSRASIGSRLRAAAKLFAADELPLRSVRYPLRSYRSTWTELIAATIVEQEGIDLIHSHFAWPQGLGGAFARALTGRPLIASLRGTDILVDPSIQYGRQANPFFSRAVGRLLATADRTVYFSNYMRDHALQLGARPEAARVVRKGVDLRHFKPIDDRVALRQRRGLGDRQMVLTVAGLRPRKGIANLLAAMALLRDSCDCTFVVCGDGPERVRLEAARDALGLSDRVVFTGRVDRQTIPLYFAACDVFVLGSVMEAAGNVVFEAMSCGRPVVCTDSGGPGEYVVDGETGFVVPVGDEEAMAARVRVLLGDDDLRERLGGEARRRTVNELDYDRMVSDILSVYREVVPRVQG